MISISIKSYITQSVFYLLLKQTFLTQQLINECSPLTKTSTMEIQSIHTLLSNIYTIPVSDYIHYTC